MKNELTSISHRLRNDPTEAEKYLWAVLRFNQLGIKFRRQAVIGRYVVDFVCYEKKLIIEVDGGQHAENSGDYARDRWLFARGFIVLRFWNHEALQSRDEVLRRIGEFVSPSLTLPARGKE